MWLMMCCHIPHHRTYRLHHLPFPKRNFNGRANALDKTTPIAGQKPIILIPRNCGNVTDGYKNLLNNPEISMADEKCAIPEWLSPSRKARCRDGLVTGFFSQASLRGSVRVVTAPRALSYFVMGIPALEGLVLGIDGDYP